MEKTKEKTARVLWLDIFKIFLVYLVICLHFYGAGLFKFSAVYRMAVPMFFLISGYFLVGNDAAKEKTKAKRFVVNSIKFMLIAFSIYIAYDFVFAIIEKQNLANFFMGLFFDDFFKEFFILSIHKTSGYHLWYLIAMFVVSLIHFVLVKYNKTKWYWFIIPFCYFVSLFFGGYLRLFQNSVPMNYTRNALFMALPMIATGYAMGKFKLLHNKSWFKWIYLILGIVFFMLQYFEEQILPMEYYICSVLSAAFFLAFFTGLKPTKNTSYYNIFGCNMPFYLYVLHVGVGHTLNRYFTISPFYKSLLILFISFIVYEVCYLIYNLVKYYYFKLKTKNKILHIS